MEIKNTIIAIVSVPSNICIFRISAVIWALVALNIWCDKDRHSKLEKLRVTVALILMALVNPVIAFLCFYGEQGFNLSEWTVAFFFGPAVNAAIVTAALEIDKRKQNR